MKATSSQTQNKENSAPMLDRMIGYLSPKTALKRSLYRTQLHIQRDSFSRSYDGAAASKRLGHWTQRDTSANTETRFAHTTLCARARDLVRNDAYAARVVNSISTNAVGTGITAEILRNNKPDSQLQALWDSFAESTACDIEGNLNFYGIQSLMMREIAEAGECLVQKIPLFYHSTQSVSAKKNKVPLALKVLESAYIDSMRDGILDDNSITLQGIKFGKNGRRLGYYLYPHHPDDIFVPTLESQFISSSEIIHGFRQDRAGQARGISWLAPVLLDLKDLSEFQDAELVRRKIAACFTAFVHDIDASNLGISDDNKETKTEKFEPGLIETLPAGKTISFANPPTSGGYKDYCAAILMKIAVGIGISYEVLTGDLSNVNFSSGRMGWLEFQRNLESWRWNLLIPKLCTPVFQWFLDTILLSHNIDINNVTVNWTPPRREMIDPVKEIKAESMAVRNGFKSLDEVHRELGYNSDQVLHKIKLNNDKLDQYKIGLDCDPRYVPPQVKNSILGKNK